MLLQTCSLLFLDTYIFKALCWVIKIEILFFVLCGLRYLKFVFVFSEY